MSPLLRTVVLAGLLGTAVSGAQRYRRTDQPPAATRDLHRPSYLHVEGARLVAANGARIDLHGINLGGWLVTEDWMCGIADAADTRVAGRSGGEGRSAEDSLAHRFGPAAAAELMAVWQDHWITEADLDRIADGGFNVVRVPISYRTLQDASGRWKRDAAGRIDFARMDWIVREAARRGLYTIFDLHVWPDQRVDYERIGTARGVAIRRAMARLWTAIAAHYRGDGAIAAFDLINEFPGAWGVQQELAVAVARGDPARVQIVEGFTFDEFTALRRAGRFPNSMFSEHFYGSAPLSTDAIEARLRRWRDTPVPIYIGEFLAADFASAAAAMTRAGVGWSSWTYKTVDMGDWGAFDYRTDVRTDLQHDSFAAIRQRWSTRLTQWQNPGAAPNWYANDDRGDRPSARIAAR